MRQTPAPEARDNILAVTLLLTITTLFAKINSELYCKIFQEQLVLILKIWVIKYSSDTLAPCKLHTWSIQTRTKLCQNG